MARTVTPAQIVARAAAMLDLEKKYQKAQRDFEAWLRTFASKVDRKSAKLEKQLVSGVRRTRRQAGTVSEQILKAIGDGRVSVMDMIARTGANPKTLRVTVSAMKKKKLIKAHGKGVYSRA